MDMEQVDGLTSSLYQTSASASTSVFCFSFLSGKGYLLYSLVFLYTNIEGGTNGKL